MNKSFSNKNFHKGMTLVETLVGLGVLIMIMVAIASFQVNVIKNNKYSNDVLLSAQDASVILKTMVKELRSSKPGNNGSYPIVQAATSSLTFFSDIDSDNLQEQVRYFLSANTLKKGVIKPTGSPLSYSGQETFYILATSIKNTASTSMFEYYDNTYVSTSTPLVQPVTTSAVRLIKISLLIDADPNRSPIPRTYISEATLRNLKDNL
jgi:type II secretory pathway pseudopilin PulG